MMSTAGFYPRKCVQDSVTSSAGDFIVRPRGSVKPPPLGGRKFMDRGETCVAPAPLNKGFFLPLEGALLLNKFTRDTNPEQ